MKKFFWILFMAIIFLAGCKEALKEKGNPKYISEIKAWHTKRIENLKKDNGWLNLVGLLWLKQGENKIGSAKSNDIVFPPGAPPFIGTIFLKDTLISIQVAPEINVTYNGKKVGKMKLHTDIQGNSELLALNSFRWNIIKRQQKIGIRLRDLYAQLVKNFKGIETFPVNEDWKMEATFIPFDPPKKIPVPNILGMVDTSEAAGIVAFEKEGRKFWLDALDEGDKLFIIFADETSGKETYGAGRFLYLDKPKTDEKFYIDFNKAYNPPCNFTKFATCPLPPKQNRLKISITAGEKVFEGAGH
jgi:uncharacterized protein